MKLRNEDDKRVAMWLEKKTDKYTAPDIQNEILKVIALQVLRQVAELLHVASFVTIMVDESTDISNKEQVVICFRWVDDNLEAHEEFVGLYLVQSTQADVLVAVILDVLQRFDIPITKLRGQCYDGAASMAGPRGGVATKILEKEEKAIYTHCYGHALNLACSDTIKKCRVMRNTLDTSYEIIKLVKKSPCRDGILQTLKQQMSEESPGIRVLCPTRWTVRAQALQSIIDNYQVLHELWQESLDIVKDTEMRSRIQGVSACMQSFEFFYGLVLAQLLLRHSDNLSKTLQATQMSAAAGQKIAEMTVTTLQSIRSDENFTLFWEKITKMASNLDVSDAVLPRRRKRPRRYDDGSEGDFPEKVEDFYRPIYFEALDLLICGIQARFDQPGYKIYSKLEEVLVKAANKEEYEEDLKFVTDFYGDDIDSEQLSMQLNVMSTNLEAANVHNLSSVMQFLKDISESQRQLISEVCTLAKLIQVMPATNAVSERSFSSLRRCKSYLRSTMTQIRLNNVMTLYVHKHLTDGLNLIDIANDFVKGSDHRGSLFGHFVATDLC